MRSLGYERLERRAMLAQTPQVIVDYGYDETNAVGPGVSEVFRLNDKFVSVAAPYDTEFEILQVDAAGDSQRFGSPEFSGIPDDVVPFDNKLVLFFDASTSFFGGGPGQEVWVFEVDQGLRKIADISNVGTTESSQTGSQDPYLFELRDHLYFQADGAGLESDSEFGLWRTDGTESGTVPVLDLIPGLKEVDWAAEVNGRILLSALVATATEAEREVWTLDGTPEGTQALFTSPSPGMPTIVGDRAYLAADLGLGRELYVSDGTVEGTNLVRDLNDGPADSSPRDLTASESGLLFNADTGNGQKLWYTDGTEAGTRILYDDVVDDVAIADRIYVSRSGGKGISLGTEDGLQGVFGSSDPIDFLGATDEMLLSRTGEIHFTFGAKHRSGSSTRIELPGEFRLATSDHFVFTNKEFQRFAIPISENETVPATMITVQPWISDGTVQGLAALGEPIEFSVEDPPEGFTAPHYKFEVTDVQQVDGYLTVTTHSCRFLEDECRWKIYAYELIEDSVLEPDFYFGDTDRDGDVDFADFLVLSSNYASSDAVWADGDFDEDGFIGFSDFLALADNYGRKTRNTVLDTNG